tara:strand:- start:49482 stop:50123 length:642 start_codon:yes stop_codon:yes gene_type:complete
MKNPYVNLERNDQLQRGFSAQIRDQTVPVESFIGDLLEWMRKPTSTYEPYARCIRESIGIGRNGKDADIEQIKKYLPRFEEIMEISKIKGSPFSKMILSESLGHRYADLWLSEKSQELECKMIEAYKMAYESAVEGKYLKNQDSAPYWLAKAYEKANQVEKAYIHYRFVLERKGGRFKQASHREKIEESRRFVNARRSRFQSTSRDPFQLPPA